MKPDFSLERECALPVAGVDEAGRGPWAGPVVAAAVILDESSIPEGVNDSKKLSLSRREQLYEQLVEKADVGVGVASVEEIDGSNILAATKLAMVRALENLSAAPKVVLVDGNQSLDIACQCIPVVKGDAKSLSIAAASIVAKVTRDRVMFELAKEFPQYGWESNSGYGTKVHQEALTQYGVTLHHRRSFKPIAALVNKLGKEHVA